MGVPKFYRWISERYPCLSEVVKEYQIPDFDNLYLDMNGIIHTCSHPNDDDPHFRITEEKIFAGICHYLDFLFRMIKPKKVFFMAVDGVAPRAKMNQQRGRRFRTAKTATIMEERAIALGEDLPTEARFDSNCITPGTEFMTRLHTVLQEFVVYKVSTDKLWKNVRVYLSGHETPGEGEHKIMDFIRYEKSQPGYDPNTRHCLYGLDADLIMLGLCSHELYFSLLREEVKFGKKTQKRIMSPEETTFHLLHISLLRDYLSHEFSPVKDKISFEFSVENIVDDFVLMSFLVGNDFIPNLPQLHIQHDALPMLFRTYMDVLPSLDGYLNEQGVLNLKRFQAFLGKLAEYDFKKFEELNDDFQYLSEKSKAKDSNDNNNGDDKDINTSDILSGLGFSSMAISKMAEFDSSSDTDGEEENDNSSSDDSLNLELFTVHKTDYYMNKLDFAEVTPEVLKDQAEGYVRAIQWNLHYYYNGVVSWSWYYPHHYSPYISDIKDFSTMEMEFDLGKPFLPFQQLLAVLPKLSKGLLPKPYQDLMCNEDSPLIDFYPDDFQTDLNGKQQEWEAIVLIPFINEKLLLKFATLADQELSEEEIKRNSHGPHLLYTYDSNPSGSRPAFLPGYYPSLSNTFFKLQKIDPDFFRLPSYQIHKGLAKGVVLDRIILGFPTLRILKHTAQLRNEKVKVFNMMSTKDNMMLTVTANCEKDLQNVANDIVGKVIYVGWPHLREALVVAVSDGNTQFLFDKNKSLSNKIAIMKKDMTADESAIWKKQVESVEEHNHERWGILVGDVPILIQAKCLSGLRMLVSREGELIKEKQWDSNFSNFPLQTTISNIDAFYPDAKEEESLEIFLPGSTVFVLSQPYYGSRGTIISAALGKADSSVTLDLEVVSEPDLMPIYMMRDSYVSEEYMPGYVAGQQLGIESSFVSHLFGTVLVQTSPRGSGHPNRVNVGLNLKFNRKNEEVLGFTKKVENTWLYSKKAVNLLNDYFRQFPDFLDNLHPYIKKDTIHLEDLYPNGEGHELVNQIVKWLKEQESASAERQKCGIKRLDPAVVKEIEKVVSQTKTSVEHIKKDYSPQQLFSPFMCKGVTKPDPKSTFYLFDRIVNVSQSTCVPTGLRGTIIGISAEENESDTMYEIVFDKEFFGGLALTCSPGKGYRLPAHSLINITQSSKSGQKYVQSPAKNNRTNRNFKAANEAILKYLQSDNSISASVQNLQKKQHQTSPGLTKPFYNVNEMFQTQSPEVCPETRAFSSSLNETSNKQFVTPKAGYVASSFPGKVLAKKNTSSPSQAIYQEFWSGLKKGNPETSPKPQNEQVYGQKVSIKELFQSVENQEANYNQNNIQRFSSEPPKIDNQSLAREPPRINQSFASEARNSYQSLATEPRASFQSFSSEPRASFQSFASEPRASYQSFASEPRASHQSFASEPRVSHQPFASEPWVNYQSFASEQRANPRTFNDGLLKFCLKYYSTPPTYNYQNFGTTHLCIASVTLPTKEKISGVPKEKREDAAASAAEKALAYLMTQSPINRNDLQGMFQGNLMPRDHGLPISRGYPPVSRFPTPSSDFRGQILTPFPPQTMYPPPTPPFNRPLMRHPSPVHSSRIPDSFVASNQFLMNNQPPPILPMVPPKPTPSYDSESFYIPGGGIARVMPRQSITVSALDDSNLFVPNQVMKQAVKTPSGLNTEDFPPLPSKEHTPPSAKVNNSSNQQTFNVSEILKSRDSPPVPPAPSSSTMTVLTKKSTSKRRIAANFQNPYS